MNILVCLSVSLFLSRITKKLLMNILETFGRGWPQDKKTIDYIWRTILVVMQEFLSLPVCNV